MDFFNKYGYLIFDALAVVFFFSGAFLLFQKLKSGKLKWNRQTAGLFVALALGLFSFIAGFVWMPDMQLNNSIISVNINTLALLFIKQEQIGLAKPKDHEY